MKQHKVSAAASQLNEDLRRLPNFLRYLPSEQRQAYVDTLTRIGTNVATVSLEDLAESNIMRESCERLKLSNNTLFSIITKIMSAVEGTDAVGKVLPHIEELQRFLSELDAPPMTDKDAFELAVKQVGRSLGRM